MFDGKEEGESNAVLSHSLTEENLRRINRRRQLALPLLSFCFIVTFISISSFLVSFCHFSYHDLYFYFVVSCFYFVILHLKKIRERRGALLFQLKEETCGEINHHKFLLPKHCGD